MTKKRTKSPKTSASKEEVKSAKKSTSKKAPEVIPEPIIEVVPILIEAPKVVEPAYVPKPFELSRVSGAPKGVGVPKSKKPWKILSERSGKHKKYNPKTWK